LDNNVVNGCMRIIVNADDQEMSDTDYKILIDNDKGSFYKKEEVIKKLLLYGTMAA
jgi:hypothetical protein